MQSKRIAEPTRLSVKHLQAAINLSLPHSELWAWLPADSLLKMPISIHNPLEAFRGANEKLLEALAERGVRATGIRLAPVVHGTGDKGGLAPRLLQMAKKNGVSIYVGDGKNRWPAVHRLDAAQLFRLALEKGVAGTKYHGVAEEGIPFIELAEFIGKRVSVPVASRTQKEANKSLSWVGIHRSRQSFF